MHNIEIYSTPQCPYCIRAKALLDRKGLAYSEIDIASDPQFQQDMLSRTGRRTVPQIFVDGTAIGGFDQLAMLEASGQL